MKLSYYKINPTGNITLIVETPVARESQSRVAAELMALDSDAEQVGFLEKPSTAAEVRLQMMGGEFCGNASISAAALEAFWKELESGVISLEVSGIEQPLSIGIQKEGDCVYKGTVEMPLPERIEEICLNGDSYPIVHFDGISHIIAEKKHDKRFFEANIGAVCRELGADALGIMFIEGDRLEPYVYVASTETAVWESSCASGTTAAAAYMAHKACESSRVTFVQPGGSLTVDAEYECSRLTSLLLTGSAEIKGKYLICT